MFEELEIEMGEVEIYECSECGGTGIEEIHDQFGGGEDNCYLCHGCGQIGVMSFTPKPILKSQKNQK